MFIFKLFISMILTNQELERLQKLACIKLSAQEQTKLWSQLQSIISFLDKLQEISTLNEDKPSVKSGGGINNPLRVIGWVRPFEDTKALLQNVKHEKINNSIVIKSVLS